jgi:hypothetical protein
MSNVDALRAVIDPVLDSEPGSSECRFKITVAARVARIDIAA